MQNSSVTGILLAGGERFSLDKRKIKTGREKADQITSQNSFVPSLVSLKSFSIVNSMYSVQHGVTA